MDPSTATPGDSPDAMSRERRGTHPLEPISGVPAAHKRPGTSPLTSEAEIAKQLREGITALRNGDPVSAHATFLAIADSHPDNENAWIGLALSSSTPDKAAAALYTAEKLNPSSRFVAQAESDLTGRLPGFTEALAAERARGASAPPPAEESLVFVEPAPAVVGAGAVFSTAPLASDQIELPLAVAPAPDVPAISSGPRLGSRATVQTQADDRTRRLLLNLGLGGGAILLILLLGFGLANSGVLGPGPTPTPTATPTPSNTATPRPPTATGTPVPTLAPPVVQVPPALTAPPAPRDLSTPPPPATPRPPDTERQTAATAIRAGRYAEAIPLLEAATERRPGDAELLYYLGVAYLNAPDQPNGVEDAVLTFRSLVTLQPEWAPGLDMLARSLIAASQFREAVTPAHQAVEQNPNEATYWVTLGRAYEGAGATDLAAKAYEEAARLGPLPPSPPPGAAATPEPTRPPTLAPGQPPKLPPTETPPVGIPLPDTPTPGPSPSPPTPEISPAPDLPPPALSPAPDTPTPAPGGPTSTPIPPPLPPLAR